MISKVPTWIPVVIAAWAGVCVTGFAALAHYAGTPGSTGASESAWSPPAGAPGAFTAVVFAHPRCPCTRATFCELDRLQKGTDATLIPRVYFYEPRDAGADWRATGHWRRAQRLDDATIIADPGGAAARAAGATTSGTVALYDGRGRLLFWGGITPSRGHEGESLGAVAIASILRGDPPDRRDTPVYGCALDAEPKTTDAGERDG